MIARTAFVAAAVVYAAGLVVAGLTLPARVATHFDGSGAADSFSSRPQALLVFAVVGLAAGGLLAGLAASVGRRLPLSLVNLPDKAWWTETPERERHLRRMLASDLWVLAAAVMWILVLAEALTIAVAHEREPHLGAWGWGLAAVVVAASLTWTAWLVLVRYRAPIDRARS